MILLEPAFLLPAPLPTLVYDCEMLAGCRYIGCERLLGGRRGELVFSLTAQARLEDRGSNTVVATGSCVSGMSWLDSVRLP